MWKGSYTLAATIVGRRDISLNLAGLKRPLVMRPRTTDRFVFEQIFLDDDYDLPDDDVRPSFIIDAGSNVGFASIYFANRYPDATIVALEPESDNYGTLVRNTCDYPQIVPMKAALWSKSERLFLDTREDSWSCRVRTAHEGEDAAATGLTIPELLGLHQRSSIDILKIDIEGAEREVFSSDCRAWLSRTHALIVELHEHLAPGCSRALESAIEGLPFDRAQQGENSIFINRGIL